MLKKVSEERDVENTESGNW